MPALLYIVSRRIITLEQMKLFTLLAYAIVVVFCLVCNSLVLCWMRHRGTPLQSSESRVGSGTGSFRNNREISQRKFLATLLIVTILFVVALLPFVTFMFLKISRNDSFLPSATFDVVRLLYFTNFVVNPFIYFWRMARYRKSIILVMCRCFSA